MLKCTSLLTLQLPLVHNAPVADHVANAFMSTIAELFFRRRKVGSDVPLPSSSWRERIFAAM